jgi:hypothetical protein
MDHEQLERLKRAARLASDVEELLDRVVFELSGFEVSPSTKGVTAPAAARTWPSPAKPADCVTIMLRRDGRSQINIDHHGPLDLSPRLTELVLFATSGPPGADGIISFRPAAEAAKALAIQKASVFNLVSRLRQKLSQQGWNPHLIETSRSQPDSGLRFLAKKLTVIKDF